MEFDSQILAWTSGWKEVLVRERKAGGAASGGTGAPEHVRFRPGSEG